MNIVLIGAPASGKGTQAKKLSQEFNLLHISTGQLLRDRASKNDALSAEINRYVQRGKLVPDDLIITLLREYLTQNGKFDGILFDGFPRTQNQAIELDKIVKIDYCFEIDISLASVISRIKNRFHCKNCGKTYIMSQHNSIFCSDCSSELAQRADDTEETAIVRYNDYEQIKNNILQHYKNQNKHHYINGEKTADEVFNSVCKIIK